MDVKKPAEGVTYCKTNLADRVSAQVTIKNVVPLAVGVEAFVEIDGKSHKAWPARTDSVVFEAFVGDRIIKVKTTKPAEATIATYNLKVLPGKPIVLDLKK